MDQIFLLGALAVLIIFMFRNNKKRKKQAEDLQASIAVGATVMLTSGIYGRITSIDGDRLVIETTPGTSLSVIKLAVRELVTTDVKDVKTAVKKPVAKKSVTDKPGAEPSARKAAPKKTTK